MAELDIEKLKSCTAIKQIPILTLDERWYHLITDKLKTDEICYWEKQVNELLKKQGQVNNDIKEVKKIKNQPHGFGINTFCEIISRLICTTTEERSPIISPLQCRVQSRH